MNQTEFRAKRLMSEDTVIVNGVELQEVLAELRRVRAEKVRLQTQLDQALSIINKQPLYVNLKG